MIDVWQKNHDNFISYRWYRCEKEINHMANAWNFSLYIERNRSIVYLDNFARMLSYRSKCMFFIENYLFSFLSIVSIVVAYRWVSPESEDVMQIGRWRQQQKISPFIIWNVQTLVLVHAKKKQSKKNVTKASWKT